MKPLIGITPSINDDLDTYKLYLAYVDLVRQAGGRSVLLPYDFEGAEALDGVIFSGGGDLGPGCAEFDRPELSNDIVPARDDMELRLYKEALALGLPILGICRGCQLINAASGGSLIADIPSAGFSEDHYLGREKGYHPVNCDAGTLAERFFGARGEVWSTHHQAVDKPAPGFTVTARSPEGVVEAIEHESGRITGLQTHPERMGLTAPFEWLISLAARR